MSETRPGHCRSAKRLPFPKPAVGSCSTTDQARRPALRLCGESALGQGARLAAARALFEHAFRHGLPRIRATSSTCWPCLSRPRALSATSTPISAVAASPGSLRLGWGTLAAREIISSRFSGMAQGMSASLLNAAAWPSTQAIIVLSC